MKKGYNSSDIPQQERQDQARRLYRFISDNARRLDDARGCATSVSDLFTPNLLAQRSILRENCERLIFLDPILYGHKGEELVWRKVYYDVVSTAKRLKKQDYIIEDIAHLQCHINAGLGYYHHFISRLQIEYDLNLQGVVDFPLSISEDSTRQQISLKTNNDKVDIMEWVEQSVHRCLIYLGDLSRYKLEIYPNWDQGLAIRYYLQASNFKPEYGMPHNQLGTLATSLNCSLDAAYHYMRCLVSIHIFEGTENNLLRLFEKNASFVEHLPQNDVNHFILQPAEHIKRFIARFLYLVDILYFDKKKNNQHIHSLCHQVLLDLQSCLSYSKPVASESDDTPIGSETFDNDSVNNPTYLNTDTIFKMIVICLLCIIKLQKNESQQISAVKAFLLAVYSQLIQNVIEHIQGSVFNMTLPSPEPEQQQQNGKKTKRKSKRSIAKLRRRRSKHNLSDDSDLSESELSVTSSPSHSDSDAASSDELSSRSEQSDDPDQDEVVIVNGKDSKEMNGIIKADVEKLDKSVTEINNEDSVKKIKRMNPMDLLEIVADEGLLQSIKILCDWLTGDIAVLKECGSSSRILLKKIIQLLNLINIEANSKKIKNLRFHAAHSDYNTIPMPEDVILKGVSILQTVQEKIDWNYLNNYIVDPKEEAFIRINKLVRFGRFLADMEQNTGVCYDKKKKCFLVSDVVVDVPLNKDQETTTISNHSDQDDVPKNNETMSRGKLMKHMGQLWLAAEVEDLENRVQDRTAFSPYLVLDVDALIHYTHFAKQLVATRKFIVLVPIIVLSALDELKRETIRARDAIRWLETQFHRGNRFLRAQRPQERAPVPLIKYPKKKDKETYTFIQIIECCHFLTQQQKGATNLVTFLTGNQELLTFGQESREISLTGLAQSAGVSLEMITTFHAKWKKSMMKGNHR